MRTGPPHHRTASRYPMRARDMHYALRNEKALETFINRRACVQSRRYLRPCSMEYSKDGGPARMFRAMFRSRSHRTSRQPRPNVVRCAGGFRIARSVLGVDLHFPRKLRSDGDSNSEWKEKKTTPIARYAMRRAPAHCTHLHASFVRTKLPCRAPVFGHPFFLGFY